VPALRARQIRKGMSGAAEGQQELLGCYARSACCPIVSFRDIDSPTAMTAAQTRIADTLETFYGAADRTSEGAMAGHAYKRSVDDLDGGFGRELVRTSLVFQTLGLT
jgi:hypothetical protein